MATGAFETVSMGLLFSLSEKRELTAGTAILLRKKSESGKTII